MKATRWIEFSNGMMPNSLWIASAVCSKCGSKIKYCKCDKQLFPSKCIYCNTPAENGSDEYNDSYDKQTGYFKKYSKQIEYYDKAVELWLKAQNAADEFAKYTHYSQNFCGRTD
jgi:hypothetical protein